MAESPELLLYPSDSNMSNVSDQSYEELIETSPAVKMMYKPVKTISDLYKQILRFYGPKLENIRTFFDLHGSLYPYTIKHNPLLVNFYTLAEKEQYDYCSQLKDLNNDWHTIGYVKNIHTVSEFMNSSALRDAYGGAIVIVKYVDMLRNEINRTYIVVNPENQIIQKEKTLPCRDTEPVDSMLRFEHFKWLYG